MTDSVEKKLALLEAEVQNLREAIQLLVATDRNAIAVALLAASDKDKAMEAVDGMTKMHETLLANLNLKDLTEESHG